MGITAKGKKNAGLLTEGSIAKGILSFAIPLFLGQLLQITIHLQQSAQQEI